MLNKLKKTFTLLEVLLVILIIGLLIRAISGLKFGGEKQIIIQGYSCVNLVYGSIQQFINQAFSSKGLYTGGNIIFPDKYIIDIKPSNNEIFLKYYKNSTGLYKDYSLNKINYKGCNKVKLSGNNHMIILYKGLNSDITHGGFEIYQKSNQVFTGVVFFYISDSRYPQRLLSKIIFDSRAKKIFLYNCSIWSGGNLNKCKVWQ